MKTDQEIDEIAETVQQTLTALDQVYSIQKTNLDILRIVRKKNEVLHELVFELERKVDKLQGVVERIARVENDRR